MTDTPIIKQFTGKYRFLSNFFKSKVLKPTLEHHFQAAKFLPGSNKHKTCMGLARPGDAKRYGRKYKIDVMDWDEVKDQVMLDLVRRKFSDLELRSKLLATGNAILVEGNDWHDDYWGVCSCPACKNEEGRNTLGKILMKVRSELQ